MGRHRPATRGALMAGAVTAMVLGAVGPPAPAAQAATGTTAMATPATTAWRDGAFQVDRPAVIHRSDVVLGRPNTDPTESMPLGNGTLGAAVWAADGFTAQLNRSDTFPDRRSPGRVTVPGLKKITEADDFTARLDVYNGVLTESGGGMTATIYTRADRDELVVDVTGADPDSAQTVDGDLWDGRSPSAAASGAVATLAETWKDDGGGGSGDTFGTLLGITASGRNVTSSVVDGDSVRVAFDPAADGSFRVVVAAPHWTGGDAGATATSYLGSDASASVSTLRTPHLNWWHDFWDRAGTMKIESADGTGPYVENLRTVFLYQSAASNRGSLPGTQAGVADLFSFTRDEHDWSPESYWWWNLRMQAAANLTSGVSDLNTPFYRLYTSNLANIEAWTKDHMPGHTGACVPETMRFNGNGYFDGGLDNASCQAGITSYNAQTVSTGAEVSLALWQQYRTTGDATFLRDSYPLMKSAAQFLLSYATTGSDGLLHTRGNAHETQWGVQDPVTDNAAMRALFPVVTAAAKKLGTDADLQSQLTAALAKVPPLPRTDAATHTKVLTPSADGAGEDVIAISGEPAAETHNSENLDLEPVWPYGLIGDTGTEHDLAVRTFDDRRWPNDANWSFDALQAARLGKADAVKAGLLFNVTNQLYPSGLTSNNNVLTGREPYSETTGVIAAGVNEALVQDYDDVLRIAPAVPSDWDVDGTVTVHDNAKVDVQTRGGVPVGAVLEAGSTADFTTRNPWPGQSAGVVDAADGSTVVAYSTVAQFTIPAKAGHDYLIQRQSTPVGSLPFEEISGKAAELPKHLSKTKIGLDFPASPAPAGPVGTLRAVGGTCVSHAPGLAGGTAVRTATCDGSASQVWIAGRDGSLWVQGKCAMPAGKSGASGTALVLAACDGSSAQQWKAGSNGSLVNQASGLCAEVKGSSTAPGTALVTATCATATTGQKFTPPTTPAGPQGHLTGIGGMCADSDGDSQTPGTRLVLDDCSSADSQQWKVASDGTLRVFDSRCMTPEGGGTGDNGTPLVLEICDGSAAQQWHAGADGGVVNDLSGRCLDVKDTVAEVGAILWLWNCGPVTDGKVWQLPVQQRQDPTGRISGYGGKCADLAGSGSTSAAGTQVQLNTCGSGASQKWTVDADGTVSVLGMCMALKSGSTADGTRVVLADCDASSTAQRWTWVAKRGLVSEKSGTCLDATGPSSVNGTPLQIWACAYSDNQRWQLPAGVPTGHIGGLGGKCADLGGSGSTNAAGTAVQLNTCGTGISQDWSVAADGTVQVLGDCMGVANNGTASGTAVTLQVCNGSNGQKWTTGADGSLVNTLSGRCLDATDASSANGTKLQIWTCGGSAQQKWSLPASV
ncbi:MULTISPECIES: ricin-type beta-trefoil lectin domain protein [unclassified Streptomyces]|uniref:ricin-type beta-trefoil lectin domain protein n=1 Tax=unclassified Streptomyces TaxID=2593676 RepID=UPI0007C7A9CB|nr:MULTISPECIES: ricin-type beta-trefoil lectin domain protein [unclassified Streptomyces]